MRRHLTSRILLSFLLLWQLGAGMFVHAHGVAPMHMQPAAQMAGMDLITDAHCAEHDVAMHGDASNDMNMQMDMAMHAEMAMDEHDSSSHSSTQPDCCQSLQCKCPCLQALALSISLPYVAAELPNAPVALTPVSPSLHAGISGLFRPPI